ncbi:macrophage mannose receptor 1-like [Clytia hemisphaerica]|uniref:C-type lectin domain-containing protein n=1 Tax=Clytia hemisphaerica TaxID=252671 RepID=A0A7M6DQA2_9CNID
MRLCEMILILFTLVVGTSSKATVIYRLYSLQRYIAYKNRVTWHQAQTNCRAIGGELLTINDEKEHKFLEKVLKKMKFTGKSLPFFWIGLNDFVKADVHVWSGQPSTLKGYIKRCNGLRFRDGTRKTGAALYVSKSRFCVLDKTFRKVLYDSSLKYKFGYICENQKPLKLKATS